MKEVIAIFDIGKTNKKVILFDEKLNVLFQQEEKFDTITDDDGFEADDIGKIEKWIIASIKKISGDKQYDLKAVNFSTYGATLMHLDREGKKVTPLYNYLKPMPDKITASLYAKYGGVDEFSRQTASPPLGMLNSGIQILWLKNTKPGTYNKIRYSLHFPQYLSFLLTSEIHSEHTSIGCHTAMWNFDSMNYHKWLEDEEIKLPLPIKPDHTSTVFLDDSKFETGIGIHDSSAALAPYILRSKKKFILISTGTWCINMNPFNYEPLTSEQLKNDCLSYMSISQKPVKSSRLFMGHMHDVNVKRLSAFFKVDENEYKKVEADESLISVYLANKTKKKFFKDGIPANYIDSKVDLASFNSFGEGYHQLMFDLTELCINSINYIIPAQNNIEAIYVTGGFTRNNIFMKCLAGKYANYDVFTSEIDNASALGAAMVVSHAFTSKKKPVPNLGLISWSSK